MTQIGFAYMLLMLTSVAMADSIRVESLVPLKVPVSNNAVALVETEKGNYLYSFLGLGEGKTWQDITSAAWVLEPDANAKGLNRPSWPALLKRLVLPGWRNA